MTRRPWTGAERLRLLRLADTLPTSALAERLGRTPKAIADQLWLLRGRRKPAPRPPPIQQGRVDGALAAEIAAARAERDTAPPYRGGPLLWP